MITVHKITCMQHIFLYALAHMSAKCGHIREIKVYKESGEHAPPVRVYNVTKAHKVACILACTDPYLGQIGWYQKDEGIYGIS